VVPLGVVEGGTFGAGHIFADELPVEVEVFHEPMRPQLFLPKSVEVAFGSPPFVDHFNVFRLAHEQIRQIARVSWCQDDMAHPTWIWV
jgi:hypothetical protein